MCVHVCICACERTTADIRSCGTCLRRYSLRQDLSVKHRAHWCGCSHWVAPSSEAGFTDEQPKSSVLCGSWTLGPHTLHSQIFHLWALSLSSWRCLFRSWWHRADTHMCTPLCLCFVSLSPLSNWGLIINYSELFVINYKSNVLLTKRAFVEDYVKEKGWNGAAFSKPGNEWESPDSGF